MQEMEYALVEYQGSSNSVEPPSEIAQKNLCCPESSNAQQVIGAKPVWFSLKPSPRQKGKGKVKGKGRASFPPLAAKSIKLNDGSATISHVHKYLVETLKLQSEDQVEILCCGEVISKEMKLNALLSWWLSKQPKHRVSVVLGSSAKQFLMELNYRPKLKKA